MAQPSDFDYLDYLFKKPDSNLTGQDLNSGSGVKIVSEDPQMTKGPLDLPGEPKTQVPTSAPPSVGVVKNSWRFEANERPPSTQPAKKTGRKKNRRREREEEYTDKDRAAAVNVGVPDIKLTLRARKKREESLAESRSLLDTEDFRSAMFLTEGKYQMRMQKHLPIEALPTLNKALELNPKYKGALVTRSQCHLKLGDAVAALKDAESCFEGKRRGLLGLYEYAEALYNLGQFERALIAFHRGYKRKKVTEFRIGIQKCQQAIRTAIGDRAATQMQDMNQILLLFDQLEPFGHRTVHSLSIPTEPEMEGQKETKLKGIGKIGSRWASKEVLGKMYNDKDYLTRFLEQPEIHGREGVFPKLWAHGSEGLTFLESREDFWRQQNPIYARQPRPHLYDHIDLEHKEQERQRQKNVTQQSVRIEKAEGGTLNKIRITISQDEKGNNCYSD